MVSFTDYYSSISFELPSKTPLLSSLLCKLDFPSTTKNLLSLLKTQKTTTIQQVIVENTLYLVLKRMLRHFLKIQPLKEILESQGWKGSYETYTEKTISDQKLNQLLTSLSIA